MISYTNPICPLTTNRATLFCYSEHCALPAFACTHQCLYEGGHGEHRTALWSQIQETLRGILEQSLTNDELQSLEKVEKQIRIVTEELKAIQMSHEMNVLKCRRRLMAKAEVEKVVRAIKRKEGHLVVTGGDMARLVRAVEKGQLWANGEAVGKVMAERSQCVMGLLVGIHERVREHNEKQGTLPKPQHIPDKDPNFTIDKPNSTSVILIDNLSLTVKPSLGGFHPIFTRQPLPDGSSFELEVVDGGTNSQFFVGVATAVLRNLPEQQRNTHSICLYASDGTIFCGGLPQTNNTKIKTGDVITVRNQKGRIQWVRGEEVLGSVEIPRELKNGELFPVVWIYSYNRAEKISKLRFM